MSKLIGGVTTSHIPAIGNAMARQLWNDPYWKDFFEGYVPIRNWLHEQKPDIAIVIYNDHGLNWFLDQIPTFAMGAAKKYVNLDEGWGLEALPPVPGDPEFSWYLIDHLVANEFDMTMCQEMLVEHGCVIPLSLFWDYHDWPVQVVPLAVNTVQHPIPSALRCWKLGKALGDAIRAYPEDKKVVVFGTGGMSHQLQGERAGLINREFDEMFMEKIVDDPESLTKLTTTDLVREAGSEGVELIMWLAMRGALGEKVNKLHSHYHIPISNTAAGVLLLEPAE